MSIAFAPFGFKAVRSLADTGLRLGRYIVASTSARIFKGDVVRLNSLGLVTRHVATDAGTLLLGVAAKDTGVIAGKTLDFPVYDDPETVYQVQVSIATATQALIGGSVKIIATTGNTTTGASKETAATTNTASASYCVRVLRLAPDINNAFVTTSFPILEVLLAGDPTKVARK